MQIHTRPCRRWPTGGSSTEEKVARTGGNGAVMSTWASRSRRRRHVRPRARIAFPSTLPPTRLANVSDLHIAHVTFWPRPRAHGTLNTINKNPTIYGNLRPKPHPLPPPLHLWCPSSGAAASLPGPAVNKPPGQHPGVFCFQCYPIVYRLLVLLVYSTRVYYTHLPPPRQ